MAAATPLGVHVPPAVGCAVGHVEHTHKSPAAPPPVQLQVFVSPASPGYAHDWPAVVHRPIGAVAGQAGPASGMVPLEVAPLLVVVPLEVPLLEAVVPLEEVVVSPPSSPPPLELAVVPEELAVVPELVVAPLAVPEEPLPDEEAVPPSFCELLVVVPPPQPAPTRVVRTNVPARPPTARRTRNSLLAIFKFLPEARSDLALGATVGDSAICRHESGSMALLFLLLRLHTLVRAWITYRMVVRAIQAGEALDALPLSHVAPRGFTRALLIQNARDALAARAAHLSRPRILPAAGVGSAFHAPLAAANGRVPGALAAVGADWDALPRQELAGLAEAAIEVAPALHALVQREVAMRCLRRQAVRIVDARDALAGVRVAGECGGKRASARVERARSGGNGRKAGVLVEDEHLGVTTRNDDPDGERRQPRPTHGDPASNSASARANPAG